MVPREVVRWGGENVRKKCKIILGVEAFSELGWCFVFCDDAREGVVSGGSGETLMVRENFLESAAGVVLFSYAEAGGVPPAPPKAGEMASPAVTDWRHYGKRE